MTAAKALICSIIGPSGKAGEVLAAAVERASEMLSAEGDLPIGFQWKRDLFCAMGEEMQKKPETLRKAASRASYYVRFGEPYYAFMRRQIHTAMYQ